MKITKKILQKIIKEELQQLLSEKAGEPAGLGTPRSRRRKLTPRQRIAARRARASAQDQESGGESYPIDNEEDEDVEAVRAAAGTQVWSPEARDEDEEAEDDPRGRRYTVVEPGQTGPAPEESEERSGDEPPFSVPGATPIAAQSAQRMFSTINTRLDMIDDRLDNLENS